MLRLLALLLCLSVPVAPLLGQDTASKSAAPISVYLDCDFNGCDFDFFRTELTMVNWVRDRQVADVHILVTMQETGSGGREHSVNFLGLRQFAGINDTLKYISQPAATQDETRKGLARVFRLGLVRYLARTPAASLLTVEYTGTSAAGAQTTAKNDPWNYWVFRTSFNGNMNAEKTYNSFNLNGNLNADRITEKWKTRLNVFQSYNESNNTYPVCADPNDPLCAVTKDTTYTYIQKRYGGSVLQVKSLGQHWSAGFRASLNSSTYDNSRRLIRAYPALEYNLFPYSESTRRQLRFEYNIGWSDFAYNDTTIFDKMRESKPTHRLTVSLSTREPWGSIDIGSSANEYLDDPSLYRIGTFAEVSVRLFKGLSLNGFGEYNMIRDQFALAKKDFSSADILLRRFQRGTGYSFFTFVGLSYTFGSIFNNVVNPRMGGFFD